MIRPTTSIRFTVLIAAAGSAAVAAVLLSLFPAAIPRIRQAPPLAPDTTASRIVAGARAQIGTTYTSGYFEIPYPNGDPPSDRGVCTDVIVRALRAAGCDLQQLIHEDMEARFDGYPQNWGLSEPDPNIDHRRVPNQVCFFRRHGLSLTLRVSPRALDEWRPGDFVYWKLDSGLDHCGVVSDARDNRGLPLVIHNLAGCVEEACLTQWEISGHFRYPKSAHHPGDG